MRRGPFASGSIRRVEAACKQRSGTQGGGGALADTAHAFFAVAGSGALAEKSAPRRQPAA